MKNLKYINNEKPVQIQLELPDYSYAYEEWLRKQKNNIIEESNTVIIIEND